MKQPELGKKIFELRKSKGLTQEELVEKCNINVRTIQRIENGEVTPRTYTVKTILEALEVDSDFIFRDEDTKNQIQFSSKEINQLNFSWIAGIFFTVMCVIGIVAEFYFWDDQPTTHELIYRIIFNILYLTVMIFFVRGYKVLAETFKKTSLKNAVFTYIVLEFIISIITTVIAYFDLGKTVLEIFVGIPVLVLTGAAELILGLGIIKLKENLGTFANTLGILKIVNGALLISIILSPIAMFLAIPILILEVIFIFNMATNNKFNYS